MARTKAPHFTLGRVDIHKVVSAFLQTHVSENIFFILSDHMCDTKPHVNNFHLVTKAFTNKKYLQVKCSLYWETDHCHVPERSQSKESPNIHIIISLHSPAAYTLSPSLPVHKATQLLSFSYLYFTY